MLTVTVFTKYKNSIPGFRNAAVTLFYYIKEWALAQENSLSF